MEHEVYLSLKDHEESIQDLYGFSAELDERLKEIEKKIGLKRKEEPESVKEGE